MRGFSLAGSKFATWLTRQIIGVQVTDPMSGFFMLRRELLEGNAHHLSTEGFKILADLLASMRAQVRVQELPYVFRARRHGSSKLYRVGCTSQSFFQSPDQRALSDRLRTQFCGSPVTQQQAEGDVFLNQTAREGNGEYAAW
jgi:hypothetical protein